MNRSYYLLHHPHFAHLHHTQYLGQYGCRPQEFHIPPPYTVQVVVCDATFEEASQHHHHHQQSFITPTHHGVAAANAEEGGPIGWVPPEERGFQHQSASTDSIASNEVSSIAYPIVDHQPQFAPTFQGQQHQPPAAAASTSNWSQQPRPASDMGIYQMAGEAVSFHQVAAQAPISMLAPKAVYHSTLLDPSSSATSPSIAFHHHSVGGSTPGSPQPAVAPGYDDVQAQHQAHLHEVTSSSQSNSNLSFSTSSGASSTGTLITPVPNASSSPSDSLYPVGMYTPCGSSESMAILNGEMPHHQQQSAQVPHQQQSQPHQLYSASGSYEVQSQYLAHQPPLPTSARAQTFHSGLSDSTSNFITSPTSSSSTPTHGAVVVQQPQPLAPSRTSSLSAWADVPPTPIVGPEHGPVMGPGVQEYHHQYHHRQHPQSQYHHHADVVKEKADALQVYSPVQQQQMRMEMVGQDANPLLAYGAQEHAMKQPVSPQAPTQPPHHPAVSRSSTNGAVPRVQAPPLSRSATAPDMSPSAAQRPSVSANTTAAAAAAALAPTRSVAEFNIAPRPVEVIKASETVRQAAKLHVDVGQADPNSPTSHEARLLARSLQRKGSAAPPQHGYSPYHREFAARRGSSASQHDQAEQQHNQAHPHQPVVPSSCPTTALPTDQDPNALTAQGDKQDPIPHGVPLPTPGMGTAVVSGAPVPAQHQTIEFSGGAESSMSPDELAKGKAIDRNAADAAAMMMGKKPFSACGFCRQRKIACGQRAPHLRDNEIGEGPRTCNQCARRHILCSFPSESRRGLRKTKPITKTIVQEDGSEVTITADDEEDEGEIEELEQQPSSSSSSKKQSKSKKKGCGPMEWIIAADAWLITPAAWAAHKAAQDKKASEGNGSGPSGAQM